MHQFVHNFIGFLLVLQKQTLTYKSGCRIETSDLGEKQPIILNKHLEFIYPDDRYAIHIPKNEKLFVSCIDENNYKSKWINTPFQNITCLSDETYLLEGKRAELKDFECRKFPEYAARFTKKKCGKSFQEIEIGFELEERFVRVLDICFDPVLQTTIYSHFRMTNRIFYAQTTGRISWINDFYHIKGQKVNDIYSKKYQKEHINSLLELSPTSDEIVKNDNRHYLARGHLTAKADVFYVHQQRTTFFTVNAAPQWQSFNNGNWKILENAVRKLATDRNRDLEIYTGTYKILELTSKTTKSKTKIFLFKQNEKVGLPVPLFFWKIVYDPQTQAGVAFIGINNPYITRDRLTGLLICQSISDKIKWVKFNEKSLDVGYCYACRLREFLNVVENAPRLNPKALLQ